MVDCFSTTSSSDVFRSSQPAYAERGLPTFPIRIDGTEKKPAIRGWQNVGLTGSTQLAKKFPSTSALGMALNSRRMVVDVDTNSESALADVLAKYGDTPLIARTASKGGYHAYYGENTNAWKHYRNSRRVIRPEPDKAVDYLGAGFAVVPPSVTASGCYEFIRGNLDDITRLPAFRGVVPPKHEFVPNTKIPGEEIRRQMRVGDGRNGVLFSLALRAAKSIHYGGGTFDQLLDIAQRHNTFAEPMTDHEVKTTAASAWKMTCEGRNRTGQHGCYLPYDDIARLIGANTDALVLLNWLKANEGPEAIFWVTNAFGERLGMSLRRMQAARKCLLDHGYIERIRQASPAQPAIYRWPPLSLRGREAKGRDVY
jgi:hypothetical protein